MITFICGGIKCGKSDLAESVALDGVYANRYYIATMKVVDEDSARRREEHIKRREGKGFITLEIPTLIGAAPDLMAKPKESVVLLECVANLVGNVMHEPEWEDRIKCADSESGDEFVRSMTALITGLSEEVGHIIVVSSEYPKEESDDEDTTLYKELLDAVNTRLSRICNRYYRLPEKKE